MLKSNNLRVDARHLCIDFGHIDIRLSKFDTILRKTYRKFIKQNMKKHGLMGYISWAVYFKSSWDPSPLQQNMFLASSPYFKRRRCISQVFMKFYQLVRVHMVLVKAIETNEKVNLFVSRETMTKFYASRQEQICNWIYLNKRFYIRAWYWSSAWMALSLFPISACRLKVCHFCTDIIYTSSCMKFLENVINLAILSLHIHQTCPFKNLKFL